MAQQYHFHFYGGPPGPLPETGHSPPVTVISTPGDARPTRSESVHRAPLPIQFRPPSRPVRAASELVDQTGRGRQPSEPERFRSRSRRRRRRHHHRRHDEVPDQAARPMSAPAEPRPVHTFRRLLDQTTPEHWSYNTAGFSFSQSGCKSREASRTMAAFFFYSSEPKAGPASLPSPAF